MSDSDYTAYNSAAMTQAVADFRSAYRMLQDELDDLEQAVEGKLQMWTGDARGAYTAAKKKWDEEAAALNGILSELGASVDNVHTNYNQAERDGVGIFEG